MNRKQLLLSAVLCAALGATAWTPAMAQELSLIHI